MVVLWYASSEKHIHRPSTSLKWSSSTCTTLKWIWRLTTTKTIHSLLKSTGITPTPKRRYDAKCFHRYHADKFLRVIYIYIYNIGWCLMLMVFFFVWDRSSLLWCHQSHWQRMRYYYYYSQLLMGFQLLQWALSTSILKNKLWLTIL